MNFEWDDKKDGANADKHGIDFARAIAVFADPLHVTKVDNRFDYQEERFITLGEIEGRLYHVVTTCRQAGESIRIISARKANKRERSRYDDR